MTDGYFKVHRKILDSQVFAHPTALKIWIWCLAKVSFKERFLPVKTGKGEVVVKINSGQFIFGRFKAEEELNIDGSTIYKWMQKFANEFSMILIESNNQYSVVTICNWVEYQQHEDIEVTTKGQPSDNRVATLEQPSNTYKKVNKEEESKESKKAFLDFWVLYEKKIDRLKSEQKWNNLSQQDKEKIMEFIPKYKISQPNSKYRKDPCTFFNNRSWENEILGNEIITTEKEPPKLCR